MVAFLNGINNCVVHSRFVLLIRIHRANFRAWLESINDSQVLFGTLLLTGEQQKLDFDPVLDLLGDTRQNGAEIIVLFQQRNQPLANRSPNGTGSPRLTFSGSDSPMR